MNRAHYTAEETVKTVLTALEDDVVNEVIIQSARSEEATSVEMKQRKLESITYQNEVHMYPSSLLCNMC